MSHRRLPILLLSTGALVFLSGSADSGCGGLDTSALEDQQISIRGVGEVSGVVVSAASKNPVAQAQVTIANQTDTTDAAGLFYIPDLHTGDQMLTIAASGFAPFSRAITVNPGGNALGEIPLPLETCASPKTTRVLFLVDSSDSMVFTDPANLIADAIETVITNHADAEHVSFGLIRWGSDIVWELRDYADPGEDVLFTRDLDLLDGALARMRQLPSDNPDRYLGGTNYELALGTALEYITLDLVDHPSYATDAAYQIAFITDGMPQTTSGTATETRDHILSAVYGLTTLVSDMTLDAVLVGSPMGTTPPEFFDLLPTMATTGGGQFFELADLAAELTVSLSAALSGLGCP